MRTCCVVVALLLTCVPCAAVVTGVWSGTMHADTSCGSIHAVYDTPIHAWFVETGSSFNGTLLIDAERNVEQCVLGAPRKVPLHASGNVNGSSIVLNLYFGPGGGFPLPGTINGEAITFSFSGDGESRTLQMTRTSSADPTGSLTGDYAGSFSAVFTPCCKLAPISHGGPITASILQTESVFSGFATISGLKFDHEAENGSCTFGDLPPVTAPIAGLLDDGILVVYEAEDDPAFVNISVNGSTITGSAPGECQSEAFNMTLTRSTSGSPTIASFTATPPTISAGGSSTLQWTTHNATSVSIDQGVGAQATNGSVSVSPAATTTYTLTATNPNGSATATAIVVVSAPVPEVALTSPPSGIVAPPDRIGIDAFTLTNIGGAPTTITLGHSGEFFSQAPNTFLLRAGESQTVVVRMNTQQAGSYSGFSIPNGSGVPNGLTIPVRALIAARPTGTVSPRASTARSVFSGVNATQGSAFFSNQGNSTVQALVVTDAPWIELQNALISTQPGGTSQVLFTVNPTKRPDASKPIGGVRGSLSLRFLQGSTPSALALPVTDGTSNDGASGSVDTSIVSVVPPVLDNDTPAALGGELALFVPGLGSLSSAAGDLLLSFLGTPSTIPSLTMFQSTAGSISFKSADFTSLSTSTPLAFPSIASSVFGSASGVSSVQLRSPDISKVSVAAARTNTSSSSGTYSEALPLFRSDRGATAGGQIVLSGLLKKTGVQTNLYVQEMSGNAGTVKIEYLGPTGSVVKTTASTSVRPFELVEVADAVPASAVAARITNTSAGSARVGAYGLVAAASTGESWVVEDTATSDAIYIPITTPGDGAVTQLFLTNRSTSSLGVSVDTFSASGRRRAVRTTSSGGTGSGEIAPSSTVNLGPSASSTVTVSPTSRGYLRIQASAGAVSVAARSVVESASGRPVPYGAGLPALAANAALTAGQSSRFTGMEDSASPTGPGALRSNLILIETTGKSAVVRVTLEFTFAGATKATAFATASHDYDVGTGGYFQISDVIGAVIGTARAAFGDLHSIQMDVEVVSGEGRILPFLATADDGSGDLVVRTH